MLSLRITYLQIRLLILQITIENNLSQLSLLLFCSCLLLLCMHFLMSLLVILLRFRMCIENLYVGTFLFFSVSPLNELFESEYLYTLRDVV